MPKPLCVTFIVRKWRERVDPQATGWRGTAERVQSGERRAFIDAHDVVALLEF